MLRDQTGHVSAGNQTKSGIFYYEKHGSLDVKKTTAKKVILRMNRLTLLPKMEPKRLKNSSYSPEEVDNSLVLKFHYIPSISYDFVYSNYKGSAQLFYIRNFLLKSSTLERTEKKNQSACNTKFTTLSIRNRGKPQHKRNTMEHKNIELGW